MVSQEREQGRGPAYQAEPGFSLNPCPHVWMALLADTGASISLFDEHGHFVLVNQAAADVVKKPMADLIGKSMDSVLPPDFAAERITYIKRVLSTGRTLVVDGLAFGRMWRSVYRQHSRPGEPVRVLAVSRPLVPDLSFNLDPDAEHIRARVDDAGALASLTSREIEILRLIGRGLSTAEIAKTLHRSVKTIEWHRVSLGSKLGVSNRVELARVAIHAGLVGVHAGKPEAEGETAEGPKS